MALMIPVSGSAYTYTYVTLGEFSARFTTPPSGWTENSASISYAKGHYFKIPDLVIILLLTFILVIGPRQFSHFRYQDCCGFANRLALWAFTYAKSYEAYIPPDTTGYGRKFGVPGIFAAASIVFFNYLGFDAVTTAAIESENPRHDLPIVIPGSLVYFAYGI
ncbi:hypothetical protein BDB00DRAFT_791796 [Zychaea mexicana]|uniref:uncharacterized protein n=1 Tax=Zychaea mexicana TaxID=64656 RepID=UPI0022FEF4F9|nr:uncharacterized protein BDB00DRAFT_791796 [Zychaea mexicana]KAI9488538.1 hypothetical protein BDB00DRAFT_791796 [Zychaea mexicana]